MAKQAQQKLPAHVIPAFRIPHAMLQEIRKLERKKAKIERRLKRQFNKESRPIQEKIEDLIECVRDKFGLSDQHVFETTTGTICLMYQEKETLNDIPDLPPLESPDILDVSTETEDDEDPGDGDDDSDKKPKGK